MGQLVVDGYYEVENCLKSQPRCLRDRERCLGSCAGDGPAKLTQDFVTTAVKQELSALALGNAGLARGRANCTQADRIVEVPLFDGGEAFRLFSARIEVRGGMLAIDEAVCKREPLACAAIQKARLVHHERSTQHTHTTSHLATTGCA